MDRNRISTPVATDVLIVVLGVLLLLGPTGTYDVGQLWRYVPSVFVVAAVWAVVASGFRNLAGRLVVVVVAGAIQLVAVGVLTGKSIARWSPVLVVLVGIAVTD